jgi:hypothetical protein
MAVAGMAKCFKAGRLYRLAFTDDAVFSLRIALLSVDKIDFHDGADVPSMEFDADDDG